MHFPASKWHIPQSPVVYSPATCAWWRTLGRASLPSPSFLWQKGTHKRRQIIFLDLRWTLQWQLMNRYLFTFSCNWIRLSMKGWKSLSASCGAWNAHSCVGMDGIHDTTKKDNMIGLCLSFSLMADSGSAFTMIGASISNRWFVNRRWLYCYANSNNTRSFTWSNLNVSASPSPFIDIRSINR